MMNEIKSIYEKSKDSYKDRHFLYLFPHSSETYCAVNYHATNVELNAFLILFDVWGNKGGHHKISEDENHQEVWFEVDEEFYQLAKHSRTFQRAIERMGVKIVFEYPFKKPDPWANDWKGMANVVKNLFEWEEGRMLYEDL